ncbi:hypothetical protein JVU11DRAFT_9696 [Chiua virens]|nr:hypothetical protein JVU11DRAFT_9696 [Chiua virens]
MFRILPYQSPLIISGSLSLENSLRHPAAHTYKYYFADDTKWKSILEYGDFDDIVIGTGFCGLAYIDKALKLNPKRRILVLERGELWLMTHFQNLELPFNLLLNNESETYPWALTSKTYHGDIRVRPICLARHCSTHHAYLFAPISLYTGLSPFSAGRSPFWSAFSPRPPLKLFRDFPQSMVETAKPGKFWEECKELLHVVEPSQLYDGEYQALQEYIEDQFNEALTLDHKTIETATYGEPADLAVGKSTGMSKVVFEKFSTPGPLLNIFERQRELAKKGKGSPLTIATNVVVENFDVDPLDAAKRADVLRTSRGALSFPRAKKPNIILATGSMPACTIVLNSIKKQQRRAGSRLSGHFLTHINARFPLPESLKVKLDAEKQRRVDEREEKDKRRNGRHSNRPGRDDLSELNESNDPERSDEQTDPLEIAAYYLAGEAPDTVTGSGVQLQYHADITVIYSPHPKEQRQDAARLCPDFFSTPTDAQLKDSQKHVIIACVMLGEIEEQGKPVGEDHVDEESENNADEEDTRTRVIFDKEGADKTTNIRLMLTMSENDRKLRTVMHKATLDSIAAMAGNEKDEIEYWHDNGDGTGKWDKSEPSEKNFQMSGIVHEASTLYMDDNLPTHPRLEEANPKLDRHMAYPSVDSNYRVLGCGNVYATGAALFPTSGSWNPTLTMCGYAQDLAMKLHNNEIFRQVFTMSIASSLANHLKGTTEELTAALAIKVKACLPIVPTTKLDSRGNPVQEDWHVVWGPAVWKQNSRSKTTGLDIAWYMTYHPNVRFEDGTLHPTYVIAVTGARRDTVDPVANFDGWVKSDGGLTNEPERHVLSSNDEKPGGRWVSFITADSAYRVLNNPAPAGTPAVGKTLLDFIGDVLNDMNSDDVPSVRFIFTGHGIGGGVAVAIALALVEDGGILSENVKDVFTYPSGVPSAGNTAFADSFEATFPARRLDKLHSHKGWNLNLVNRRDVVPQAWCIDKGLSPKQNLYNLSSLVTSPPDKLGKVLTAIGAMCHRSEISQLVYKPIPSQYFTCAHDFDEEEPRTNNDVERLVFQHLKAYHDEVGIDIQPWVDQTGLSPSFFPVIYDLAG